jgi:CRISPR system Cascade subunit CasB
MSTTEAREYPIDRVLARVAIRPDALATRRRGVGRPLDDAPGSWPYVMEASGGSRFREEPAHVALGLFALHQQSQHPVSMNRAEWGLGRACRTLRHKRAIRGLSEDGVERRFRAALATDSLTALAAHLRGLVTLLRGEDVPLDYSRLFWDLTSWRSAERRDRVALQWAREYFMTSAEEQPEEGAP